MFDNIFYTKLLDSFIQHYKRENRFIEFKSNYLDAKVLGEYISALSNGACLDHVDFGYLFLALIMTPWLLKERLLTLSIQI